MCKTIFRKRSREEDGSDFMPLSKRITNLHINASSSTPMQSDNDITDYNMNLNQQHQTDHSIQFHNPNQFGSFSHSNGELNQLSIAQTTEEQKRQLHYQQYLNECNNASSSNGSSGTNVSTNASPMEPYDPELSQEENPFYYTKNKLLYDLYMERLRRCQ